MSRKPLHQAFGISSFSFNLTWLISNLQSNISLIENSIQMKISIILCYVRHVYVTSKWRNAEFVPVVLRNSRNTVILNVNKCISEFRILWTQLRNVSIQTAVLLWFTGAALRGHSDSFQFLLRWNVGIEPAVFKRISPPKSSFILPRVYESVTEA